MTAARYCGGNGRVSLSTVNRAHMAYDHGSIEALKPSSRMAVANTRT